MNIRDEVYRIVQALIMDIEHDMGAPFNSEAYAKVQARAVGALQQAIDDECEGIRERVEQIVGRR